jgi:hypothetical protein
VHRLADWCAFLGAWLLFAGPIYQAETELHAEGRELEELRRSLHAVPRPTERSHRWWLLGPAAWNRRRRAIRELRRTVQATLPPEQTAQLVHFREKATGWMLVAGGAGLIAVAETWALVHASHWPAWLLWPLLVLMVVGCVFFTVAHAQVRAELLGLERRVRGRGRRDRSGRGG